MLDKNMIFCPASSLFEKSTMLVVKFVNKRHFLMQAELNISSLQKL